MQHSIHTPPSLPLCKPSNASNFCCSVLHASDGLPSSVCTLKSCAGCPCKADKSRDGDAESGVGHTGNMAENPQTSWLHTPCISAVACVCCVAVHCPTVAVRLCCTNYRSSEVAHLEKIICILVKQGSIYFACCILQMQLD